MNDLTRVLSDFVFNLKFSDLDEKTVDTTKLYIADYFAASFAGMKENAEFGGYVKSLLLSDGGKEEASVLLTKEKLPVGNAAFMNAIYAHGADMDDGNKKAMGHVAAHVMSAVFAVSETVNASYADVITAINAGYEVYNRISAAVQPGLAHRGFHSTGTAGIIAAAAATAKLMGLSSDRIYNAMSMAAVQSSGLLIIAESGQCCKPLNPANAAKTGIFSAKMAALGSPAPVNVLQSKKGWFHAMSDEVDESAVTENLGKEFTICDSYLKPYPSCRHTHCGIEAAIKVRKQLFADGLSVKDIQKINLYIYENAISIAGQIKVPANSGDAKFSVHYSLVKALTEGKFGLAELITDGTDKDLLRLTEITSLIPDETMENREKGIRGARLEVTADGKIYGETVLVPKGDGANPMNWEEIIEKARGCAENILSEEEIISLVDKIKTFGLSDKINGINTFFEVKS